MAISWKIQDQVHLPAFFPMQETIAEWKDRCRGILERIMDERGTFFLTEFDKEIKLGRYTKIPPTRETTPLEVRYEWAARRVCLNLPFKQIARESKPAASEDAVKKAVNRIIREAELNKGK